MDLKPLFEPRTMAVFGVSASNYRHPANEIFNKNLLRYPIGVYGVNPRGGTINGQPIHRNISEVPEEIDMAVIAVRADVVPEVITECIEAKVRSAVIVSGGFAEVGRGDLQERIVAIAKEAGFPFVGPNCLGIYVPSHVDTFFLPGERMVTPVVGNVSFVSQSGGILVDQMIKFANEGVGLAKAISIGNKALLGELDLLDYFAADPATKVIAFYIEGFGGNEGRQFVLRGGKCGKPVVVLKSGKTEAGSKAVSSHTASLAGDYASFSAVLSQYHIVEAVNELELISFCESLSAYAKPIEGRVGIVTVSGGHGAIAVDTCASRGLSVPGLPENIREDLCKNLGPNVRDIATLTNPVDLTGSGVDEDFVATMRSFCSMENIDCVLALLLPYIPGITSDLGAKLGGIARQCGKPLIAYVPNVEKYAMLIEGFTLNGSPVAHSIEGAVLMVDALRRRRP
ncbi:MAG: CoA-binding protein [Deltaproteobacteria bacterium]|nr:CoA-binding protein [Deltaproteobacteria bacterium]